MAVAASNIQFYYSTSASVRAQKGSASTAASSAAQGLGGYLSGASIADYNSTFNVFDNISGTESNAGDVEYRCILIYNTHSTSNLTGVSVWLGSGDDDDTGDPDIPTDESTNNIALALDYHSSDVASNGSGPGFPNSDSGQQMVIIADEDTAPSGSVTSFSTSHYSSTSALGIGAINAGRAKAIWLKRTATGQADDSWDFTVEILADSDDA